MSSVLRPPALRVEALSGDLPVGLVELVDADPIVNAVVGARLRSAGSLDHRRLGGTLLAVPDPAGGIAGGALAGGNLMPFGGGPGQWRALGRYLAGRRRPCSSIIGRAAAVERMWGELSASWDTPRAVRRAHPLPAL